MKAEEIVEELGVEESVVDTAINANGFFEDDDFTDRQVYLIKIYIDYMDAQEDAKEQRKVFQYSDGEESVNKSSVYNQHRRYAMDLLAVWREAKRQYDYDQSGRHSFHKIRKRARFLNERTR